MISHCLLFYFNLTFSCLDNKINSVIYIKCHWHGMCHNIGLIFLFNTFASQSHVLRKKLTIFLENASNLTQEFLWQFLQKNLLNFLQRHMSQIWCIFKKKQFISGLWSESVKGRMPCYLNLKEKVMVKISGNKKTFFLIIKNLCKF